jgi:hypothetical protein
MSMAKRHFDVDSTKVQAGVRRTGSTGKICDSSRIMRVCRTVSIDFACQSSCRRSRSLSFISQSSSRVTARVLCERWMSACDASCAACCVAIRAFCSVHLHVPKNYLALSELSGHLERTVNTLADEHMLFTQHIVVWVMENRVYTANYTAVKAEYASRTDMQERAGAAIEEG